MESQTSHGVFEFCLSNCVLSTIEMGELETKTKFQWSLKPIDIITKFIIGIDLHFSGKKSLSVRLLCLFFAFFVVLSNFLINGPRGLKINSFEWMKNIQNYDNPHLFFSENPDALLQFVVDIVSIMLWVAVFLIHFLFLVTVLLSQKWNFLKEILELLENDELAFTNEFYRKCLRRNVIAIFILLLV